MKAKSILQTFLSFILMFFLVSMVVQFLWNRLLTDLFALPAITYSQALGLLLLSRIFFGGGGGFFRDRFRSAWSDYLSRKAGSMTPQEKEAFRERWEKRCGDWGRE